MQSKLRFHLYDKSFPSLLALLENQTKVFQGEKKRSRKERRRAQVQLIRKDFQRFVKRPTSWLWSNIEQQHGEKMIFFY